MTPEEQFMNRALELAATGLGRVRPNPCVGCVIVSEGEIIGEGWHQEHGGPHAEINAVSSIADKSKLRGADVYVNLEPCSHHGKTPPCADFLIASGVKKVVISTTDTNPLVAGNGIKKLRDAGVEVVNGVLQEAGRTLNRRFFTFMEKKRPYVILKWAQTADKFIAREDFSSKWISGEYARQLVHRWRSEEAAVMVGTSTAAHDDPALSVREWTGRQPLRIVADRYDRLPGSLKLFDGSQPTLCYTLRREEKRGDLEFIKLGEENFFHDLLDDLYRRKVQSVLVEGGRSLLKFLIAERLWDEARIFTSRASFTAGIEAPVLRGNLLARQEIGDDLLEIFTP